MFRPKNWVCRLDLQQRARYNSRTSISIDDYSTKLKLAVVLGIISITAAPSSQSAAVMVR